MHIPLNPHKLIRTIILPTKDGLLRLREAKLAKYHGTSSTMCQASIYWIGEPVLFPTLAHSRGPLNWGLPPTELRIRQCVNVLCFFSWSTESRACRLHTSRVYQPPGRSFLSTEWSGEGQFFWDSVVLHALVLGQFYQDPAVLHA